MFKIFPLSALAARAKTKMMKLQIGSGRSQSCDCLLFVKHELILLYRFDT